MSKQSYFGEFVFDHDKQLLLRRGLTVRLQAQPARVLSELLLSSERVVTREELRHALWGDDTHVDFEKGLNFCIGQIRAALQDNASRPLYIRTIPKQGYQFIAPLLPTVPQEEESVPVKPSGAQKLPWLVRIAVPGVVVLVATGLTFRLWVGKAATVPNIAVVRFDVDPNSSDLRRLGDVLTDDIVVQLAGQSLGHYRVIGNAAILRKPRDQRDLKTIGTELNSSYAVLGQMRVEGDHVLILAHLIRLSDQTHISVWRAVVTLNDPSSAFEASTAAQIASRFATALADRPDEAPSFPSAVQ
jgi:DNA-binding winged helix-turn-helix (wHTH) protein/TolB-like protein